MWCPLQIQKRSAPLISILSLATLLITITLAQEESTEKSEYEKGINEIFSNIPPPTEYPNSINENGCICVPYYKCNNDTVVTDGTGLIDIRINISSGMNSQCPNYLDICCYTLKDPAEFTTVSNVDKRTNCGQWNLDGVGFRITGGTQYESQYGEFPWMVAILKYNHYDTNNHTYKCGGSLIHPRVILTGAHCINNLSPNDLVLRVGEWDTQTTMEMYPHQDGEALKIIKHENYYGGTLYNDIALIFTKEPFVMRENVGTLCLPPQNYKFTKERCFATGWGKNVYGREGVEQAILKKIDLPIVEHDKCLALLRQTRLGPQYNLHKSFMCAGGEIGKDTCSGDGGSPLMCPVSENSHQFHQAGIVAWGIGCGEKTPGVYVNVAIFRNWIDQHVLAENLDTSYYDASYNVPSN